MLRSTSDKILATLVVIGAATALIASCSASSDNQDFSAPANGGSAGEHLGGAGEAGNVNPGGHGGSSGADGGVEEGGIVLPPDAGEDVRPDVPINVCGSQCGPEELCDQAHLGYDDDCDGVVDEGCPCTPGLSHWCFKGDPASRGKGSCKDGVAQCNEIGTWGACVGGFHADTNDDCLNQANPTGCHDLKVAPFTVVRLKDGTGTFGDAATGEHFEVQCPPSIPAGSCPQVQNPDGPDATFTPLQSGEYRVTYTKDDGAGGKSVCMFSIYVGASGLRVELNWDHQGEGLVDQYGGGSYLRGPDLDLHVHRPGVRSGWFGGAIGMLRDDCYFGNCKVDTVNVPGMAPSWFSDTDYPHNWTYYLPYDPNDPRYTCYYSPRGQGQVWRMLNRGCHNPRLDLDNITCDPSVTDPNNEDFCAPENVNIDELPVGLWTRIGVHYYGHCYSGDLHPTVTIYCAGNQVAQFGATGFDAPVTFSPSACPDPTGGSGNAFWLVADVMMTEGPCGEQECVVQPIYRDANAKTPYIMDSTTAETNFGPPCAPAGSAGPGCF